MKIPSEPKSEDDGPAQLMLAFILFGGWAIPIILIPLLWNRTKKLWNKGH